jgi:bifunctional non-homologous end joining protein LigD
MTIQLEEYNKKRNFGLTGEPAGETGAPEERLKFAVQHHMARSEHYDLRLEWNGVLLSWAVPKGPSYDPRDKRLAVQVEDHPLEYRNFEGTIPKGEYGGGSVMLWDEGWWEPQGDAEEGLARGSLKFALKGRRLKGKWALIRMKGKAGEAGNNWLFIKERDEYAGTGDNPFITGGSPAGVGGSTVKTGDSPFKAGVEYAGTENGIPRFDVSIRTGRTMAEIAEGEKEKITKNPFDSTGVQLAKLVNTVPAGPDWLYEMKYDGYRILAYLEGSGVRLMTRNGIDYTDRFADAAYSLSAWAAGRAMVLDGEMAVTDAEGKTDFQALQNFMKNPEGQNLTYIIFDLLALDGADLRGRPLAERKETLQALMRGAPKNLHYSQHISGNGEQCLFAACQANAEGIVGKRAGSVYSGTRNGDWIKVKCGKRQEFVIGGYTLSDKKTSGVSSLLLGVYEGDELVYAGRAGTGFTARTAKELEEKFTLLRRSTSPFKQVPARKQNETITWLEPELAAEIRFAEWTGENLLRQASFKGLRTDKDPREIRREDGGRGIRPDADEEIPPAEVLAYGGMVVAGIKISNPDKVIYEEPAITKADVVRYYAAVAERMLPYVSGRILSIVRCPRGVSQTCFFKKHPGTGSKAAGPGGKGVVAMPVINNKGETEDYFYIENTAGLIYEAQMGTLEFHTWGSRADNLERPDIMVFDLDPDVGMDPARVRQGVKDLKSILEQLSVASFLKTSGGKGYHVVVPFTPAADWDTFYGFARRIAEVMEKQWPDRYTSNVRKASRKNRIFIDWIRNGRGATSIAPYSLRARSGARVSMPISWEELDTAAPDGFGMEDALARIGGPDPWRDFFRIGQRLK